MGDHNKHTQTGQSFDPEDLVIFVSKRGYWNRDKEKFVKDRAGATPEPWHSAELALVVGEGHFELAQPADHPPGTVQAEALRLVDSLLEMTPAETWHPVNHPLNTPPGRQCRKCDSPRVSLPAYNGDYFDCLDCGHSWAPTATQARYMANNPASHFDANGRRPKSEIKRIVAGEWPLRNSSQSRYR